MTADEDKGPSLPAIVGRPIHDLVRPTTKVVGDTMGNVAKAVLAKLNFRLLSIYEAQERAHRLVSAELERRGVREEAIQEPAPEVGLPIIGMLRSPEIDTSIRDLYIGLLATAMDKSGSAHPAYSEIIRQLTPLEARLVPHLVSLPDRRAAHPLVRLFLTNPDDTERSLGFEHASALHERLNVPDPIDAPVVENLARLGLVAVEYGAGITASDDVYKSIVGGRRYQKTLAEWLIKRPGWEPLHEEGYMLTTDFGFGFAAACLGLPPAPDVPVG